MSALNSANRSHIGKISAFPFFASFHPIVGDGRLCVFPKSDNYYLRSASVCSDPEEKRGRPKGGCMNPTSAHRDLIPTSRTMFDSILNPLRSVCITPFKWWFSYIKKRGLEHGVGKACSWGGWCLLLRLHKGLSYVMNFYKALEWVLSLPLGLSQIWPLP